MYYLRHPKLHSVDVNMGEACAALPAVQLGTSEGCTSLFLEGDSLTIILAINKAIEWSLSIIANIHHQLQFIQRWIPSKITRSANFRAHHTAKLAASNLVSRAFPILPIFFLLLGSAVGKITLFSPPSPVFAKEKRRRRYSNPFQQTQNWITLKHSPNSVTLSSETYKQ
jgi:hypothetical protein